MQWSARSCSKFSLDGKKHFTLWSKSGVRGRKPSEMPSRGSARCLIIWSRVYVDLGCQNGGSISADALQNARTAYR